MKRSAQRQEGIALIVTTLVVLLAGLLALVSIEHSGADSVSSARASSTSRALLAADGGMQLAFGRVSEAPPNLTPINITIGNISVQSRTRADTAAQNLDYHGTGAAPEGYGVNVGSGYTSQLWEVDMTSLSPNGSTAQLQSKFYTFDAATSGY